MKRLVMFIVTMLCISIGKAQNPPHPRLFFGSSDIPTLQSRATTQTTPPTKAYELWTQIIRDKEAKYFAIDNYGGNKWMIASDAWQMENLYAIALAYIITSDVSYRNATHDIVFGYTDGGGHWITGLVNTAPYTKRNPDNSVYFDEFRYRVAQVTTLSMVTDLLWDQLTSTERTQIMQKVKQEVDYINPDSSKNGIREFLFKGTAHIENNHLSRYSQALLFAAITFYGESGYPDAANDIEQVRKLLLTNLNGNKNIIERLFDSEGSQMEGVEYGLVALCDIIPIMQALKRWDGIDYFSNPEIQKRLSKFTDWLAYEVIPSPRTYDSFFNNINDSDIGTGSWSVNSNGLLTGLLMLGGYYGTPTVPWVFQNTTQTVSNIQTSTNAYWHRYSKAQAHLHSLLKYDELPYVQPETILPKSKYFPDRGLVYVRSSNSWADNHDVQFAFENAPCINPSNGTFSIKHDQADKNHFTLNAFGKQFIRDFGRGEVVLGKRPETHNYILINADGQMKGEAIGAFLSEGVQKADWNPRSGKIASYTENGTYTFIHGDAKDAFGNLYTHDENGIYRTISNQSDPYFSGKDPNWAYVNPVLNADRYINFNQSEENVIPYLVIADDINKDGTIREYRWLFHSDYYTSGINPSVMIAGNSCLKLWYNKYSGPSTALQCEQFTIPLAGSPLPDKPPGIAALSNLIFTSSNSFYFKETAVNPYFHVVMIPFETCSQPQPIVTAIATTNGSCFNVDWTDYSDYSTFRYSSGTVSNSIVSSNAKLIQVRKNKSTLQVTSFSMNEGSNLAFNTTLLAETYGVNAVVMFSNSNVTIDGQGVGYFRVYAPNTTSVKINGTEVGFVQVGDYVESNNISIDRTWSGNISSNFPVTISATLKIDPGSTFKTGNGSGIFVNGKLIAKGNATQRITFTSSSTNPYPGEWPGIICNGGGPDTLTYCDIKYAENGLNLTNTAANSYIANSTIENSSYLGMFVGSTGTSSTALKLYKTEIKNNDMKALLVNNAKVLLSYSKVENNQLQIVGSPNIYVCNGGKLYVDSTRIQNNIGRGIDVSGVNSRASLSIDGVKRGYNTLTQNALGELYVHNSATAYLGNTVQIPYCYCDDDRFSISSEVPDCPTGCYIAYRSETRGGWNNVINTYTFPGKLIDNATSVIVYAQYTYWGTHQSGEFIGPVDYSNQLTSPAFTPSKTTFNPPGSEIFAVSLERERFIQWLLKLKKDIELNREGAIDALQNLAQFIGPGGEFQDVLGVLWENFLTGIESSFLPNRLKAAASVLRLQSKIDSDKYDEAIELADNVLNRFGSNQDVWLYCNTRKIFASVGKGDRAGAWMIYNAIKEQAKTIDSTSIKALDDYLKLSAGENHGKSASGKYYQLNPQVETQSTPKEFLLSQNYPNPFNPLTVINYQLPTDNHVTLKVYNILGEEVTTLVNGFETAGYKSVTIDGSNLSSGMYFYRLTADGYTDVKKMLLMK
jgi:hypothetical protein